MTSSRPPDTTERGSTGRANEPGTPTGARQAMTPTERRTKQVTTNYKWIGIGGHTVRHARHCGGAQTDRHTIKQLQDLLSVEINNRCRNCPPSGARTTRQEYWGLRRGPRADVRQSLVFAIYTRAISTEMSGSGGDVWFRRVRQVGGLGGPELAQCPVAQRLPTMSRSRRPSRTVRFRSRPRERGTAD